MDQARIRQAEAYGCILRRRTRPLKNMVLVSALVVWLASLATAQNASIGESAISRSQVKAVALKAGIYWQNVTPRCFDNSVCSNARYFESTEADDPSPLNQVGTKNLLHKAIWNSTTFGVYCVDPEPTFGTEMMVQFSAGVLGHK